MMMMIVVMVMMVMVMMMTTTMAINRIKDHKSCKYYTTYSHLSDKCQSLK